MNGERKNILRTASALMAAVLVICTLFCGCSILLPQVMKLAEKNNAPVGTSTKYMVGFDYSSYKDVFGLAPVITCTVRYDKSVDAVFGWTDKNGEHSSRTLNFPLTDEQYSNIDQNADPREIYYLDPKCSDPEDVCDGGASWLFVYGTDDAVMKECGGFCPRSERFHEIRRMLFDNLPEELIEAYSQYEEIYDARTEENAAQTDEEFRTLFEETFSAYIED